MGKRKQPIDPIKHTKACDAINSSTKHGFCRRRVTHGDLCWKHAEEWRGLRIKPSKHKGGGRGLFATENFPKHKIVSYFKGPTLTANQVEHLPQKEQAFCVPRGDTGYYIDAFKTDSCMARYANEARKKKNINAELVDAPPRPYSKKKLPRPALESEKPIKSGKEIETDYGPAIERNYPHWSTDTLRKSTRKRK
jgi:hypothetical protein